MGIVVGGSNGLDLYQPVDGDFIEQAIKLIHVATAQENPFPVGMEPGFNAVIERKHSRGEQLRPITADEHLHGLVAKVTADLLYCALRDDVASGDEDDAIGDTVNLVENVAGDD